MVKNSKSVFFCNNCGYESLGWRGKCPACNEWNSFVEEPKTHKNVKIRSGIQGGWIQTQVDSSASTSKLIDYNEIQSHEKNRFSSGIAELDRVLGGGFVPGSLVLFGGDPGIGKSTLLLQVCQASTAESPLLYICGEESPAQIKLRGARLGIKRDGLKLLAETHFESIVEVILQLKPSFVIVDSIQTLYSETVSAAPGSVSQVRDCAAGFLRLAKSLNLTVILIGHVTKEGILAGPRVLEHMVDTVLSFEGDPQTSLRMIRGTKNRFGTTHELAVFEMTQKGLIPLPNPSVFLLAGRPEYTPGAALTASLEGSHPLIQELQALLVPSHFGSPQRMTQGFDRNRLNMLLAIGDKFLKAGFDQQDVYLNVVGGFKIQDTATDLAVLAALLSGTQNKTLPSDCLILGELGLTGELRPITRADLRIHEAIRLGFCRAVLPGSCKQNLKNTQIPSNFDLIYVDNLPQAVDVLL